MFVYGDVVIFKIGRYWPWKTVTVSSHLHMPVRPTLLHRMALVSFLLFRKNLGNLREFFGQMVYRPPGKKIARTPMPVGKSAGLLGGRIWVQSKDWWGMPAVIKIPSQLSVQMIASLSGNIKPLTLFLYPCRDVNNPVTYCSKRARPKE